MAQWAFPSLNIYHQFKTLLQACKNFNAFGENYHSEEFCNHVINVRKGVLQQVKLRRRVKKDTGG